jgi:PTH1 family peptidyl-tRNA hydrolase
VQGQPDDNTRFVVGLGNPGRRYAGTRHNLGFRVVERLVGRWASPGGRHGFAGVVHESRPRRGERTRRVVMLTPLTYMNRSGRAVAELVRFYKAGVGDVLVVLDDMALPAGRLRARAGGSAGGHNGLADVLASLGTQDVPRLRIGIASPPPGVDPTAYVLGRFEPHEAETIDRAVRDAEQAVEDWVFEGIDCVMERYNRKGES